MGIRNLLKKTETLPYLFFIINIAFKLVFINAQDICIDEPFTIYHAQFGIGDIITFLKPTNNPPLYEIILHFWIKVFGISAFSVRFLPVVFASATVIFIYKITRVLFNKQSAVTAACVFTFSNYVIYYSHDSRAYPLFLLLATASFYYFIKLLREWDGAGNKFWFFFINVLMIYTHYFGFIVWFVQAVYLLIYHKETIKSFFVHYAILLIFFLPQMLVFFQRATESAVNGTWITNTVNAESLYNKIVLFSNMPMVAVICLVFILFYLIKKVFVKSKLPVNEFELKNEILILIWFFVPLLMMFAVSLKLPVFLDRYFIFISPAFYIMLGFIVNNLFKNKHIEFYVSTALILVFALTLNLNPDKKRDVQGVVEYVKSNKGKTTIVIVCAHDFINNFTYYFDKKIFTGVAKGNEYHKMTNELNLQYVFPVRSIDEVPQGVLNIAQKVIYVDAAADFSNPGNRIYETLKGTLVEKNKKQFRDIFTVYEFKKN